MDLNSDAAELLDESYSESQMAVEYIDSICMNTSDAISDEETTDLTLEDGSTIPITLVLSEEGASSSGDGGIELTAKDLDLAKDALNIINNNSQSRFISENSSKQISGNLYTIHFADGDLRKPVESQEDLFLNQNEDASQSTKEDLSKTCSQPADDDVHGEDSLRHQSELHAMETTTRLEEFMDVVTTYKCKFCRFSCPWKSGLMSHIRNCHIEAKKKKAAAETEVHNYALGPRAEASQKLKKVAQFGNDASNIFNSMKHYGKHRHYGPSQMEVKNKCESVSKKYILPHSLPVPSVIQYSRNSARQTDSLEIHGDDNSAKGQLPLSQINQTSRSSTSCRNDVNHPQQNGVIVSYAEACQKVVKVEVTSDDDDDTSSAFNKARHYGKRRHYNHTQLQAKDMNEFVSKRPHVLSELSISRKSSSLAKQIDSSKVRDTNHVAKLQSSLDQKTQNILSSISQKKNTVQHQDTDSCAKVCPKIIKVEIRSISDTSDKLNNEKSSTDSGKQLHCNPSQLKDNIADTFVSNRLSSSDTQPSAVRQHCSQATQTDSHEAQDGNRSNKEFPTFNRGHQNGSTSQGNNSCSCHHNITTERLLQVIVEIKKTVDNHTLLLNQLLLAHAPNTFVDTTEYLGLPILPVTTMEEHENFELFLSDPQNFTKVVNMLRIKGGDSAQDVTRRIMQSLISNELASILNWCGRGDKYPFKNTTTRLLVMRAVRETRGMADASEKDIEDSIKSYLKYAPVRLKYSQNKSLETLPEL